MSIDIITDKEGLLKIRKMLWQDIKSLEERKKTIEEMIIQRRIAIADILSSGKYEQTIESNIA